MVAINKTANFAAIGRGPAIMRIAVPLLIACSLLTAVCFTISHGWKNLRVTITWPVSSGTSAFAAASRWSPYMF